MPVKGKTALGTANILNDIAQSIREWSDRTAMVIEGKQYRFSQMGALASRMMDIVSRIDDPTVGIVAENCAQTYAAILATLFSGKTYVILHPDFPDDRNARIIADAGIETIVYCRKTIGCAAGLRQICSADISMEPDNGLYINVASSDCPAYIIFTSGSTGRPKGVPISRDNLNAFYAAYRQLGFRLDHTDRMLQMFELTFDVSVVSFLYPLTLGASVYTVPSEGMKYLNVLDVMESGELTFAAIAPSVLRLARPYFAEISLPKLRYLVVTAEATDVKLMDSFRGCIPNAEVVNLYGPTEATIYCTAYPMPASHCKHHNGMAAIGKPFPGMTARIVDEAGSTLPDGQEGELWIAGPQVMSGYWHAPERSASCFLEKDGQRFYRTGDRCIRDADGDLLYCGREDSQVKIQGFRVELDEIAWQAKAFYNHSRDAVVLAATNSEGNVELHLFVEGENGDESALLLHLQHELPPYMVPHHIHFVAVFPLNSNNKTDKRKLKEKYIK